MLQRVFTVSRLASAIILAVFLAVVPSGGAAAPPHPIHISVCDVVYNARTQGLEIMVKIFADDAEAAVEKALGENIGIYSKQQPHPRADELLFAYLKQNLEFELDGQAVELAYVGRERETDAVWIYLEVVKIPPPRSFRARNTICFNLFDDQANLVHFKVGRQRKSFRLTEGAAVAKHVFE